MGRTAGRGLWPALLAALACLALPSIAMSHQSDVAGEELSLLETSVGGKLYVVGYAHLDTQWRWAYPQVIREYIPSTLHGNFRLFEKYPGYIFNFSGSRRYEMMKEYYPQGYEQLKAYVAARRWFPCGSSVDECDANCPSAESIIRQVLYGNHYFRREFGIASEEFMLPDCFGFPASMPAVLSHCGLRGFSTQKLSWGSANGIPFNVGVWEGLDGSSILVSAFNPGAYVGKVEEDLSRSEKWIQRLGQNNAKSGVPVDYHYFGTGDTGGAPGEDSVQWIEQSARSEGPLRVVSSTAQQMFLDLTPEQIARLPRYKGDLMLTQHSAGSITSQAYMKRWNHMNELLADSAERAAASAALLGGPGYPQEKLNRAWGLTLGSQMHDILPGTSIPKAYEYSWNDEVLALNQFADVLQSSVTAVASGMDTRGEGIPLVVYNPVPAEREDLVEATVDCGDAAPEHFSVRGPDGAILPAQLVNREGSQAALLFLARVPSSGFAVYHILPGVDTRANETTVHASGAGVENERYRITLNGDGDVSGVYDKLAGREMLSAPIRLAFTTDAPGYWPAWNIDWDDQSAGPRSFVAGPAEVEVTENGPLRATIEVRRKAEGSTFVQRIRLAAGSAGNRVVFDNTIDWLTEAANLKAVFPFSVSNPQATYNWGVGAIERGNNDEKKYEVPHHQWLDLTDTSQEYGVTVLSPYKYGSDKPDDNTLRLTLLRTPGPIVDKEGKVSDDYRDQTSQDWGRHEISFGLSGHSGGWQTGQTPWQALCMEQPLTAFQTSAHGGNARSYSLVGTDSPNIRVMAFKKAEDGGEYIVRLVEMTGTPTPGVSIIVPGLTAAREVDGQERSLGAATAANGQFTADFGPFAVRSYALTLAAAASIPQPKGLPLTLPLDSCVATRDGEMSTGGFDGNGRCLAAEMLPETFSDAGVAFQLAPGGGGRRNAVSCKGQPIALPEGGGRLYILAAASPAGQEVSFGVDGMREALTIQDWGGFLGQWDNRTWEGEIPELAFEWPYKLTGITPAYTKRAPVAWYCSHRHNADGRNDIYGYSYLYRYSLDIPRGARELRLPDNPNVKVLSASLVQGDYPPCTPCAPLYDELKGHPGYEFK